MSIRPLYDRVVVKPLESDEKTSGGILLPDTAKEKPIKGQVVAVGKGKVLENGQVVPLMLKVGDKIIYGKYSGTDIKFNGEELKIMKEDEVLAKIE